MSDYEESKKTNQAIGVIAESFSLSKGLLTFVMWSGVIFIPIACTAYFSWTYRGHLEEEARKGVIVTPLEYEKTIVSFPKLGYKIVLERITNEENFTLAEMVYKQRMLEQQMIAHKNAVFIEAQAVAKKKQEIQIVQNYEQNEHNQKLAEEIGKSLDISPEDQNDLKAIILGEN
jgi:hypothetical protein